MATIREDSSIRKEATTSASLDRVLARLDWKWTGSRYIAQCPAHADTRPSLSIGAGADGTVLVHCFAGCLPASIVASLGLTLADLFPRTAHSARLPAFKRKATVQSLAVAAAKRAYSEWQRTLLSERAAAYRELCSECEVAEIAYRAIHRVPHLYSEGERHFWTHRLATIYDRLAPLEYDLDILTYDRHEAERFAWWTSESEGHHA